MELADWVPILIGFITALLLALVASQMNRFIDQVKLITTEVYKISGIVQSVQVDQATHSQIIVNLADHVKEIKDALK